jgi:hypothetical protein
VDCGGSCNEGACFQWCATVGDEFAVIDAMGGVLTMTDLETSSLFECKPYYSSDGSDCAPPELARYTLPVVAGGSCVGDSTMFTTPNVLAPTAQVCSYECLRRVLILD